ncbi:Monodehydroascorbate reductase (NADH) [Handroanthus impetiginosus]|uniref:Monodehydroascorbate reductase (NADH) n=1 Tax=Handroanthus impetiginosus TaxID=429701 RepID=A0A2G9H182_9LAMI|nr:Monodehydroascorbate reductase (NADH) [Handroanthus impetiginosus]
MTSEQKPMQHRVAKVDSEITWDMFLSQANNHGLYIKVVVHFSAFWCMPSIAMKPFFEELALTHQDILFLLVDVDEIKEVT